MKNILFPTDFSEAARQAFIYALHLADKFGAMITTLHAFEKPYIKGAAHLPSTLEDFYRSIDLYEFESYRDAIPPLNKIAEENGFNHIELKHVMEEGQPIDTILKVTEKDKIDLIVMGTTGARGLREIFLGSVAGEILENADCPVLAVPEKALFDGKIDHIAFTTNYQDEEKKALDIVLQLAKPFEAKVHCVNVDIAHTHFYHKKMEQLKTQYAGEELTSFEVLEGMDIKKELIKYLETNQVDILAMVTHKRSFIQELFNYSRTKMMSYHAKTPVLAIPAESL